MRTNDFSPIFKDQQLDSKQQQKKIVGIEDEAQTRNMFLECLEAEGFDAIGAENGLVGVQRAQSQLPDLVICDIMMPELDGYRVQPSCAKTLSQQSFPSFYHSYDC